MTLPLTPPEEDFPPGVAGRLDEVCDRFEEEWQAGRLPRLEDFLRQGKEADRPALLRELLQIELFHRGRQGKPLPQEEYRRRLAGYEAVVTAAFSDGPVVAAKATSPSTLPEVPGYEVLSVLGQGGMGVVYKARQLQLKRLVALKMVLAGELASPRARTRFLQEAQAVARLHHANVVQVYEVGEHQGCPYLSLELVEGGSLARKLREGPLPPRESARLAETLARAVAAIHGCGVVHRDLKPTNVLLAADGSPKITDFGLARDLDGARNTVTGEVLGTPSYMAPEQARGDKAVGPAADTYALGAILYECLTGRPPFRAATSLDTLYQVLHNEPVQVRGLQPRTPVDLETICLKCLRKEPARRYASAEELANDLRRYQAGQPIRARPVGAGERAVKWARQRPALAALTLVSMTAALVLLIGGLWFNARLAEQRNEALKEADKAKKARDFLVSIFRIKDVQAGNTTTARQILIQAEQRIPIEFAEQPELRDELLAAIEEVNRTLDRTIPAAMILEARGGIQLHSPRGDRARPVPQTLLYPDDRLTLAAAAQVQLLFLSDLHKERLQAGREAAIGRKSCSPADAVRERVDDVLMPFVRLKKGTFFMGWNGTPGSAKKTEILEDFEIAVHDVTQGQWQAIMGSNPSRFSRTGGGRDDVLDISDEELKLFPVENVPWEDVQAFIQKLNEKYRASGYLYRLPSEAEWEYACRGGATSLEECSYHFYFDKPTNELSSEQANFNGSEPFGKAPQGPFLRRTTRVGAYPSNKLGLCDMHGNVWQWTATTQGPSREDRGGGWGHSGSDCRASSRLWCRPGHRDMYLGFRLARAIR